MYVGRVCVSVSVRIRAIVSVRIRVGVTVLVYKNGWINAYALGT